MRLSQMFGRTLREPPAEVDLPGLALAVRAGFVRPVAGRYVWLPLGDRVFRRAEEWIREGLEELGGLPLRMWQEVEAALGSFIELARREVRSYRDLPRLLYRVHWAEGRSGPGLLGAGRWLVEAWSLHAEPSGLESLQEQITARWEGLLHSCGLPAVLADATVGEAKGVALVVPGAFGRKALLRCQACGYVATAEAARFDLPPVSQETVEPTRPIATPGCATIADVARYVGVDTSQTLKAVFYAWERPGREPTPVFVVLRGDLEVNETKLRHLLEGGPIRPATDDEIRAIGAEPGYASPVGLNVRRCLDGEGVLVVGDPSIRTRPAFVAGANREGYHLTGVNYPRDFTVTLMADVAQAQPGHLCPCCGGVLDRVVGVGVAVCRSEGTALSERLDLAYLDRQGGQRPVWVGRYVFDLTGLLTAVLEVRRDEHGIVWPTGLAPFGVHLVSLARSAEERQAAERVYGHLRQAGFEVLYDDRDESPGAKFADADLIGCPVRVTVSRRSLAQGGVEVKTRWSETAEVVPEDRLGPAIARLLDS